MMMLKCKHCGRAFMSERRSRQYCSVQCSAQANGDKRAAATDARPRSTVFSSGGGVQSTAIAVLIATGRLSVPDFAIMVDVGFESARTLDYAREITQPRLAEVGCSLNIVKASDYANVDLVLPSGVVCIPAFMRRDDGSVAHFATYCNNNWKAGAVRKYVLQHGGDSMETWLGISTDEAHRARASKSKSSTLRYPLIEMGLSRKDCVQLIKAAGWPLPMRTSCVCCPQRTDSEWLRLMYEQPEDFKRAEAIERQIRRSRPDVFLHRKCVPLREALMSE